jgi:hypothetical protein
MDFVPPVTLSPGPKSTYTRVRKPDATSKFPAVRCQLDVTRCAVEQSEPDATLQLFDQHAEARWRDEKRFGRAGEIVMLGRETESAQLPGTNFHY